MNVTPERISLWAQAISETEEEKCQNALSAVIDVMRDRFGSDVKVIKQGSHRNRTNVRADSDVDIAVVHKGHYFPDISKLSDNDKALHKRYSTDSVYTFEQFKADVHKALQDKFGTAAERKNKCIRVAGNTYRVNADVVPAYGHKRFRAYDNIEAEGIGFKTDKGVVVYSYPDQHYNNGVEKNTNTSGTFKAVVRILKNTRNEMAANRIILPDSMSSFLVESLVWNVPPSYFSHSTYREDARAVALKIWSDMREPSIANNYAEVSDLKWLLRGEHTPAKAEAFMLQAWHYLEQ